MVLHNLRSVRGGNRAKIADVVKPYTPNAFSGRGRVVEGDVAHRQAVKIELYRKIYCICSSL
jgi:hypothetical protein